MANEKRLIDANALKKNKTVLWDEALGFSDCVLVEDIDNAPTVDAELVRHSFWKAVGELVYCYSCGNMAIGPSAFCPGCGAKMDGGANKCNP